MPHTLLAQATYVLYVAICAFALWKGDRWQRAVGLALLSGTILMPFLQDRVHWRDAEFHLLIFDGLLLALFIVVAMLVGRTWILFCAAFQLLSTVSHLAVHMPQNAVNPIAYLVLLQLFNYGGYLSLGVGVAADVMKRAAARAPI